MSTLSVCIIAKNEAANIERAITTILPVADEIVVVDTGSTDTTKMIARKYTDKIYDFAWVDDFAAAYNYCQDRATKTFCIRWDADFSLLPADAKRLLRAKKSDFNGGNLVCLNWVADSGDAGQTLVMRDLIFKRTDFTNKYPIHAKIVPRSGVPVRTVSYPDIFVQHHKSTQQSPHRYTQTATLLAKALQQFPNDTYLLAQQLDGLLFTGLFQQAVIVADRLLDLPLSDHEKVLTVEKKIRALIALDQDFDALECAEAHAVLAVFPRFQLMYADVVALFDPETAIKHYQTYLASNYGISQSIGSYNAYRFQVHPLEMLVRLSKQLGHTADTKRYERLLAKSTKALNFAQ